MKRSLSLWQLGGMTFSAILGTLLHFVYDWTNLSFLMPISAINESTWEHMKLLFFPTFIYAIIQSVFFLKEYPQFWRVKVIGISVGLILIPTLFYTYNGALGKSPDWFNILSFFIALGGGYFVEYLLFKYTKKNSKFQATSIIWLFVIAILFIVFTFAPLKLPIFISPV